MKRSKEELHDIALRAALASDDATFREVAEAASEVGVTSTQLAEAVLSRRRRELRSLTFKIVSLVAVSAAALTIAGVAVWALTQEPEIVRPRWATLAERCRVNPRQRDGCLQLLATSSKLAAVCRDAVGWSRQKACLKYVVTHAKGELDLEDLPRPHLDELWFARATAFVTSTGRASPIREPKPEEQAACDEIRSPRRRDECMVHLGRCDLARGAERRRSCFAATRGVEVCQRARSAQERAVCAWIAKADPNMQPENCYALPGKGHQMTCLHHLARTAPGTAEGKRLCGLLSGPDRATCFTHLAKTKTDHSACARIENADPRDACFVAVATTKRDRRLCRHISRPGNRRACLGLLTSY